MTGHPRAAGPDAAFYAIGDVAGGGASSKSICGSPCPSPDTSILWEFDGVNPPTLTKLPEINVVNLNNSALSANAITRDGVYIASGAREQVTFTAPLQFVRRAVRVTNND